MKDLKLLHFLKILKYLAPVVFLPAAFSSKAPPTKDVFSISITQIIAQEYELKTSQDLNKFIQKHSLEDLIAFAERSDPRAQKLAFFL